MDDRGKDHGAEPVSKLNFRVKSFIILNQMRGIMWPKPISGRGIGLGIIVTILMILLFASPACGVTFEWDANTDNPVGYVVYFNEKGETDTPYNTTAIVHPTTTVMVDDLRFMPGVTYEVWATAYNARGESGRSNIVEYSISPFSPPAENLPIILDFPTGPTTFKVM